MHIGLLFLVLSITLIGKSATADDNLNLAPILELGVRFVLLNLKRLGSITVVEDRTIPIPESVKNISTGTLTLKNAQINGFQTMDIKEITANKVDNVDTDVINPIYLSVKLLFDEFGFSSKYDADIGIIDEIPIYGDGDINLAISQTDFDLSLNIYTNENFSSIYVDTFTLNLEFRDAPSSITNFWKSETISELLTTIINVLEKLACMWLSYEKECVSCVLNPVLQYIINSHLPNDIDNNLEINCTCLEGLLGEEYTAEDLLNRLVTSYQEGNMAELLNNINKEEIKQVFQNIGSNTMRILKDEGIDIEL